MSPAVNVTLEEVPFAILEAVKARILANRRRLEQPKPRPSLRPRAQFRRFGASSRAWRKPQYAAAPGGGLSLSHSIATVTLQQQTQTALVAGQQLGEQEITPYTSIDWAITSGNRKVKREGTLSIPSPGLPQGPIAQSFTNETYQVDVTDIYWTDAIFYENITYGLQYTQRVRYNFSRSTSPNINLSDPDVIDEINDAKPDDGFTQDPDLLDDRGLLTAEDFGLPSGTSISANSITIEAHYAYYAATITSKTSFTLHWSATALQSISGVVDAKTIALPVGGESSVVILMMRASQRCVTGSYQGTVAGVISTTPRPTIQNYGQPVSTSVLQSFDTISSKAFLCTPASVREISIPAKLQTALDVLNPRQAADPSGDAPITQLFGSRGFGSGPDYFNGWTPDVFSALNDWQPNLNLAIVSTPGYEEEITPDTSDGYYGESPTDGALYYLEGDTRSDDLTFPQATAARLPDDAQIVVAWDWDDPAYCRALCLALGFTEADLKP